MVLKPLMRGYICRYCNRTDKTIVNSDVRGSSNGNDLSIVPEWKTLLNISMAFSFLNVCLLTVLTVLAEGSAVSKHVIKIKKRTFIADRLKAHSSKSELFISDETLTTMFDLDKDSALRTNLSISVQKRDNVVWIISCL